MRYVWEERFWGNVDRRDQDECWPWMGKVDKAGYGRFWAERGLSPIAHRLSVMLSGREIKGAEAHHLCGSKGCVNPGHVVMLTPSQHRLAHRNDLFHCKHGHPWTRETTIWRFPGIGKRGNAIYPNRQCRVCGRLSSGHRAYPTYWTKEDCIKALRECAQEDGRTPRASDFNESMARRLGFLESAARHKDRGWPHYGTITSLFGSWREAVTAAGMKPRRQGDKTGRQRWARMPEELKALR